MSSQRFAPEFKDEAVRQIVERGYKVADVAERLWVSMNCLCKWVKAVRPDKSEQHTAELVDAKSEVAVSDSAGANLEGACVWNAS